MKSNSVAAVAVSALLLLFSCKTTSKTLKEDTRLTADTGSLSRHEMEAAAEFFGQAIHNSFSQKGVIKDIFVALLPTKNDTTEQIPVAILDNALVQNLSKLGIFTVRTEDRKAALTELQFNLSGFAGNTLSAGNMTSPNYFIKMEITENMFRNNNDRIMEHTINAELRSVETQIVLWGDKKTYQKKLAKQNKVIW